jgi:plasmid stability protein
MNLRLFCAKISEVSKTSEVWLVLSNCLAIVSIIDYNDINAITGGVHMASITIRNLDESLKTKLRLQSAQHGCSMEAEVRNILRQVLIPSATPSDFADRVHQRFAGLNVDSLPIPARQAVRTPPDMDL